MPEKALGVNAVRCKLFGNLRGCTPTLVLKQGSQTQIASRVRWGLIK